MYIKRAAEEIIGKASSSFPVLWLTGARQVGKTTLLRSLMEEGRSFVTLDDPLERNLAKSEPKLFLSTHTTPLFIDEAQYAPELLPYIKMAVDNGASPGSYWLTGSQTFDAMKGITETLAGRVAVLSLGSLSNREIFGKRSEPFIPSADRIVSPEHMIEGFGVNDVFKRIFFGGMPSIVSNKGMDRDIFFSSYFQTYIERDIRSLINVSNEGAFTRFVTAVAARSASLLSLDDLGRDAGVSVPTAKAWLSLLESSGLVFLLEPFHSNLMKRLTKTPKLYMLDTGLCSYLTRWNSPETLESGAFSGNILETWVVSEIYKSYQNGGKMPPLYFYRDSEKREIDLLILDEDRVHPIEVKKTANPSKKDIRNFKFLVGSGIEVSTGGVICLADSALPLDENNWIIPIASI